MMSEEPPILLPGEELGRTVAVITVGFSQLRPVSRQDIAHAGELAVN